MRFTFGNKMIICLSSSSHIIFHFYCLFILILMTTTAETTANSNGGNGTDHQALLSIKSMITYDPYGVLSSWNTSLHFCDWGGVSCGKRHKRVIAIELRANGLQGSLSPHAGNLSFLRVLNLMNNSFQGSIPHELGRLSRLRVLDLSWNKFNDVIPTNISGCSKLEELWLRYNKLVGIIPMGMSFLSKLRFVAIDRNHLTGGIPPFLGNLTSIEGFSTMANPLGGSIPDTLGHLKSLNGFYCSECQLHGTIPPSFYNLSLLTIFSLSDNQLSGTLPTAFGTMLPNLSYLQLWGNQLTGLLPTSISNCSLLRYLEMNNNNFSGKMTIDFANLRDIYYISLYNNNIGGLGDADEMKFIDSLENCSSLEIFDLGDCTFQGVLPGSIGNLSHQLHILDLQGNQLYGNLPLGIGNLLGLETLSLGDNRFTGSIPFTISNLRNVQAIGLYGNQFSGSIPDAIGNLSLLLSLFLQSNGLEGIIPSSLGNCHQLLELYLHDNKLSGQIPKQLFQLPSLSITLNLSQNSFSGSLPVEVGDLKMLNQLDLSFNNLSGDIPGSLGGCTSLLFLSLRGNLFQGVIPQSLSSLRGLVELDVSQNNFSGHIPQYLERFSLEYMNLSFNDFEGQVPTKGVFANASAFSVLGNSKLCGGLVELGLAKCKETEKHKKGFPVFVIAILIACTLFTIICLAYAWCKRKGKGQPDQSSMNEKFLKVSYNQLLTATNGFSEANLIGLGGFSSVYKGMLDVDDGFVAIKVLHLQIRGAHRSFTRECEAWRRIRHRNLLKIITSCSSVDFQGNDFKALVYEFMPNGSLHDWLHSRAHTSRLNLLQRMTILIDVATALDYLHNHCQTTIVHGDLKPSNILLDDDMVAHVGDFGLAQFLGIDSNQNSSIGVKGTIGYAPPEYGLGSEMTSSGDLYSFGILLLELMTGKKPTENIFNEGLNLHKFVYMALPDHVNDVIDNELTFDQEEAVAMKNMVENAKKKDECLTSTLKIGLSCSIDTPSLRMNIETVVHDLQHIMDKLQHN